MPAVIVRKVISSAMSNRESVGSFSESQRAKAKRPDPRNILPQTGQSDTQKATGAKATDAADAYEHILTIQNAADLEFPAIRKAGPTPPNAPNSNWASSAGSSRPARNADADTRAT